MPNGTVSNKDLLQILKQILANQQRLASVLWALASQPHGGEGHQVNVALNVVIEMDKINRELLIKLGQM